MPITYLGFEGMIFLRQIFLSEVVFVAPLVSPFVNLVLWYVYILKVMVRSISTRFGGWDRYLGECSRQTKHKRQAKEAKLYFMRKIGHELNRKGVMSFEKTRNKERIAFYYQYCLIEKFNRFSV